jgi:hypothetical protein
VAAGVDMDDGPPILMKMMQGNLVQTESSEPDP